MARTRGRGEEGKDKWEGGRGSGACKRESLGTNHTVIGLNVMVTQVGKERDGGSKLPSGALNLDPEIGNPVYQTPRLTPDKILSSHFPPC